GNDAFESSILAAEGVNWVARHNRWWRSDMDEHVSRDLRMQVAHGAHFFNGHAFGHELLFHRHNLGGVRLAGDCAQALPDKFGSSSRVQMLDNFLKGRNSMRPVVNQFAHSFLLKAG